VGIATGRSRNRFDLMKATILALREHGELSITQLVRFCGLNYALHRPLLDELVSIEVITRREKNTEKKTFAFYKLSPKGIEFCKKVLEGHDDVFTNSLS